MTQKPHRRIGLLVHFFDFRNDVRELIAALRAGGREVVLLVRPQDEATIRAHAPADIAIRQVREQRSTLMNRFWDRAMHQVGRLPKSRRNYELMERFKIDLQLEGAGRQRALKRLSLRIRLPDLLDYDTYLDRLSYAGGTDLSGLDEVICFTDIADSYLLARLVREGIPASVYVYSWDHPCKHYRYSRRVRYRVWSSSIQEDLSTLQGIRADQVLPIGASQFGYIDRYLPRALEAHRPWPFDYLYFGCAVAIPSLVPAEVDVIEQVARALARRLPDWRLVVRAYPPLAHLEAFHRLATHPNVVMDEGCRTTAGLAMSEAQILDKFTKTAHARAFLHLGTTLGVEAAYTPAPSLILDLDTLAPKDGDDSGEFSIYHFVHQWQNERYLIDPPGAGVIRSEAHLEALIDELGQAAAEGRRAPAWMQAANRQLAAHFPVRSFETLAQEIWASVGVSTANETTA